MTTPKSIRPMGDSLMLTMGDGLTYLAFPAGGSMWLISGSDGGGGVVDPPPTGDGSIYNPWGVGRGAPDNWESHYTYSAGGYDWSWGSGVMTDLPAPAAGVLHTSGGSGEFTAGAVGSAGNRSILYLDVPVARVTAKSTTLMNGSTREADGPMVAIVLQHQSTMGVDMKHYNKAEICGISGNTNGTAEGGDWHVHVHGLTAEGARVDFYKFV